jgi:hypothetical protein
MAARRSNQPGLLVGVRSEVRFLASPRKDLEGGALWGCLPKGPTLTDAAQVSCGQMEECRSSVRQGASGIRPGSGSCAGV